MGVGSACGGSSLSDSVVVCGEEVVVESSSVRRSSDGRGGSSGTGGDVAVPGEGEGEREVVVAVAVAVVVVSVSEVSSEVSRRVVACSESLSTVWVACDEEEV